MPKFVTSITLPEQAAPGTPASGGIVVYAKADGSLYYKNDAGLEVGPLGAGGGAGGTATNVVTSAKPTANKLTVDVTAAPPASPAIGDLWVVTDSVTTPVTASQGSIFFGSDPNVARPDNSNPVLWVGYDGTIPVNAQPDFDVINTFAAPLPAATAPPLTWRAAFWANDIAATPDTALSTWTDRSGNSYNATNATGGTQPFYRQSDSTFNTRPVVDFTTVNSRLLTPSWTSMAQPNTIAMVVSVPNVVNSTQRIIVDGLVSTSRNTVMRVATTDQLGLFAGSVFGYTAMTSTPHLVVAVFNGTSSYVIIDGVKTTSASNPGAQAQTGLTIGARVDTFVDGFGGKMAFIGTRPGVISDTDAATLHTWAKANYGTP